MCTHAQGLAEEEVQDIDAMGGDVVQRPSAGLGGIDQPTAIAFSSIKPSVAGEFGEHGLADRAGFQQLFCTQNFGISAAIESYAENASTFFGGLHHRSRFGLVHGHRLLTQHMLAGAKSLNRLGGMQEDGSR